MDKEVVADEVENVEPERSIRDELESSLAEVTFVPQNYVKLEEKAAEQMLKLMEILDEHDDVQKAHANFDIPDEIMEKVAAAS